jgi:hypothetical protein
MVRETDGAEETYGKRTVCLNVLPLPSDPTRAAGVVRMDDPDPNHMISFHRGVVMEFETARKLAWKIAGERKADLILIVDPMKLLNGTAKFSVHNLSA